MGKRSAPDVAQITHLIMVYLRSIVFTNDGFPKQQDYNAIRSVIEQLGKVPKLQGVLPTESISSIIRFESYKHFWAVNNDGANDRAVFTEGQCLSLARVLAEHFFSIPITYTLYIPMVGLSEPHLDSFKITETVSAVRGKSHSEKADGGRDEGAELPNADQIENYLGSYLYFTYKTSGYIHSYIDTVTVDDALSLMKLISFLGIEKDQLYISPAWEQKDYLASGLPRIWITPGREVVLPSSTLEINQEVSLLLSRVMALSNIGTDDGNGPIEEETDICKLNSRISLAHQKRLIDLTILAEKIFFDPKLMKVKLAINWWFDSLASQNSRTSFLFSVFGFEALLGDLNEEGDFTRKGITSKLADRLAYLVADDITERDTIRKKFREIYELRSSIVHQLKAFSNPIQYLDVEDSRYLLSMAIRKELTLLGLW